MANTTVDAQALAAFAQAAPASTWTATAQAAAPARVTYVPLALHGPLGASTSGVANAIAVASASGLFYTGH